MDYKKSVLESRATWTPENSLAFLKNNFNAFKPHLYQSIPWKFRSLIVPFFEKIISGFGPSIIKEEFEINLTKNNIFNKYFEVQDLGNLSLDDIEASHFKGNPPDTEFFEYLKKKKIKVFDACGESLILYDSLK